MQSDLLETVSEVCSLSTSLVMHSGFLKARCVFEPCGMSVCLNLNGIIAQ